MRGAAEALTPRAHLRDVPRAPLREAAPRPAAPPPADIGWLTAARQPLAERRRLARRRWLVWAACVSLAVHLLALVAVLVAPPRTPPEPAALAPHTFDMVLEAPSGPPASVADRPAELPSVADPAPAPPPPPAPTTTASASPAPVAPPPAKPDAPSVRAPLQSALPAPPAELPEFVPAAPSAPPAAPPAPPPPAAHSARPSAFPRPLAASLDLSAPAPAAPPAARGTGAIDLRPGQAALNSMGAPPPDPGASDSTIRVRGAHLGKDWQELLHEWWARHSYYPAEAARRGQDGTVTIHVHVRRDGKVKLVELETGSGSIWLDAAAQAVFRNAVLPPFLPSTPENEADLDITIDYVMLRG